MAVEFGFKVAEFFNFLIDELLGGSFAKMAARRTHIPVKVIGPPFECVPSNPRVSQQDPDEEGTPVSKDE